jgi:hypothetical protein
MDNLSPLIFDGVNTIPFLWLNIMKPKLTFQKTPNLDIEPAMKKKMGGRLFHLVTKIA